MHNIRGVVMNSEKEFLVSKAVKWHIDNEMPFTENLYKPQSEISNMILAEAKVLYATEKYMPKNEFEKELLETDIGEYGIYKNKAVPLDFPIKDMNNSICVYIKDKIKGIKKLKISKNLPFKKEIDKNKAEYWGYRLKNFDQILENYSK